MQWLVNQIVASIFSRTLLYQTSRVRPPQIIPYFHKMSRNVSN